MRNLDCRFGGSPLGLRRCDVGAMPASPVLLVVRGVVVKSSSEVEEDDVDESEDGPVGVSLFVGKTWGGGGQCRLSEQPRQRRSEDCISSKRQS